MSEMPRLILAVSCTLAIAGCAAPKTATEEVFGKKFPLAASVPAGEDSAHLTFSADKKYESKEGTPLAGEPLICTREGVFRVNEDDRQPSPPNAIDVKAGEELAVTSLITFNVGGWMKRCWPFVTFTPERGARYVVVGEEMGAKGLKGFFRGVKLLGCEVSVYKETQSGFDRVETRKSSIVACQKAEQQ